MSKYLLLRNNKESGPFSFDELANYGLKPYDLIWVEGKSAAWRYPSEVQELKQLSPAVEEQPFDRFFKKNSENDKNERVTVPLKKSEKAAKQKTNAIPVEEKYRNYIPKKSVAVTFPGQRNTVLKTIAPKQQVSEPAPAPKPAITVTENPAIAQVKYSQPLDEIKEMYVKTLQQRKSKIARKSFVIKNLKRAGIVAALIAIGLFAGLLIKSGSSGKNKNMVAVQSGPATEATNLSEESFSNSTFEQNNPSPDLIDPAIPDETQTAISEPIQQVNSSIKQKPQSQITSEKKKAEPGLKDENPVIQQAAKINPITGERSSVVRGDNKDNPDNNEDRSAKAVLSQKNSLGNKVTVSSNDYKRVAFGGIRNLELTVTNDSKYVLDKVTVQLQYLKPSEEPLKTENIDFYSVSPKGTMTMRIPDTNRGIKVSYKIVEVESTQMSTASASF